MALAISGICRAEVPKLLAEKDFNSISLVEAANHFINIGEAATFAELNLFLAENAAQTNRFFKRGYDVNERIGWIFRILYQPKSGISVIVPKTGVRISGRIVPLRPPEFGWLGMPETSMPAKKWPLYPLALFGSTYLVLREGYTPRDTPETMQHYMEYCRDNGTFRKTPVPVSTRQEALDDAELLRQSSSWKAIKWLDNGGIGFPRGQEWTWQFIERQAGNIPQVTVAK